MKTKIILSILILFSFSFAQESKVPKEVLNSFAKLYPNITDVKWDKEDDYFEANFKKDSVGISVVLDKAGNLKETETAIQISMLPEGVQQYVNLNYKGYEIKEAAKIVKSKGEKYYEAEVSNGNKHKDLLFDLQGKVKKNNVKSESKEKDEDDKD
jgi:hypothetical protein